MKKYEHVSHSPEETEAVGYKVARETHKGRVVCLYGDLGAGKTTFVKGFAKGLGITRPITSPTFLFVKQYSFESGEFYHVDLYRIESEKELEGLGLKEVLRNKNNTVVIEWSEKLGRVVPDERIDIQFEYLGDDQRKITITRN